MTQHGHGGQHHGRGAPGCPRDLHHHHDERCDPVASRRQRAREAFDDIWRGEPNRADGETWPERLRRAREACVEDATRVKITPELVAEVDKARVNGTYDMLEAAFRAVGIEVEE